jgi:GntR family transcriptional regulator / MocR family aminotransferase
MSALPDLPIDLNLPPPGSRQRLRELHRQLRDAIIEGRLHAGFRLPSTRDLAQQLGMSRNTVVAVYELLLAEGYISSRAASGHFVSEIARSKAATRRDAVKPRTLSTGARVRLEGMDPNPPPARIEFAPGIADAVRFPHAIWGRLLARSVRALSQGRIPRGQPQGQASLRAAIARHVAHTRAVACDADSVIVVNGSQQAFDLLARTLVIPGQTRIAIEDPGYSPPGVTFAAAGARLMPTPVDDDGLRVDKLKAGVDLVYVTPSHQYPLGCILSSQRRAALIDFARRERALVIEDDYDAEHRYDDRPLDALQTLDRHGDVVYVGTLSKILYPTARLGFIVAPPSLLPALVAAKRHADSHTDVILQEAAAAFIAEGHLMRHLRRMRQVYGARRQLILDGLQRDFTRWLRPVPGAAGLHIAALAVGDWDVDSVVARAREAGIGVRTLSRYALRHRQAGMLFGYGAIEEPAIIEGLQGLLRLMKRHA